MLVLCENEAVEILHIIYVAIVYRALSQNRIVLDSYLNFYLNNNFNTLANVRHRRRKISITRQ